MNIREQTRILRILLRYVLYVDYMMLKWMYNLMRTTRFSFILANISLYIGVKNMVRSSRVGQPFQLVLV